MDLNDLSDYCVVKKYKDGWLVHPTNASKEIKSWKCRFISNQHLVRMGYLSESSTSQVADPPRSSIIVVPPVDEPKYASS